MKYLLLLCVFLTGCNTVNTPVDRSVSVASEKVEAAVSLKSVARLFGTKNSHFVQGPVFMRIYHAGGQVGIANPRKGNFHVLRNGDGTVGFLREDGKVLVPMYQVLYVEFE